MVTNRMSECQDSVPNRDLNSVAIVGLCYSTLRTDVVLNSLCGMRLCFAMMTSIYFLYTHVHICLDIRSTCTAGGICNYISQHEGWSHVELC